jgi:hypothetical protein
MEYSTSSLAASMESTRQPCIVLLIFFSFMCNAARSTCCIVIKINSSLVVPLLLQFHNHLWWYFWHTCSKILQKYPCALLYLSTVIFAYNSRSSQPERGHAFAYACSCGYRVYVRQTNVMSHKQNVCPTNKLFDARVTDRCTFISPSVLLNWHSWRPPAQFAELRSRRFVIHTNICPYLVSNTLGSFL